MFTEFLLFLKGKDIISTAHCYVVNGMCWLQYVTQHCFIPGIYIHC